MRGKMKGNCNISIVGFLMYQLYPYPCFDVVGKFVFWFNSLYAQDGNSVLKVILGFCSFFIHCDWAAYAGVFGFVIIIYLGCSVWLICCGLSQACGLDLNQFGSNIEWESIILGQLNIMENLREVALGGLMEMQDVVFWG